MLSARILGQTINYGRFEYVFTPSSPVGAFLFQATRENWIIDAATSHSALGERVDQEARG